MPLLVLFPELGPARFGVALVLVHKVRSALKPNQRFQHVQEFGF